MRKLLFDHIKEYRWQVAKWAVQYVKYLVRHIWFVCLGCWKEGLFFAGIFHDLNKWSPEQFIPYMLYFYGVKFPTGKKITNKEGTFDELKPSKEVALAFDYAWLHHQKANRHHWQYWLLSPDNPRPNFRLGSYGDVHVYGVDLYEHFLMNTVFHKSPEDVIKESADDLAREYRLEDDLNNTPVALDMPMRYRKEMLADWRGAGRAISGKNDIKETARWYLNNRRNVVLHPDTRKWVEDQLGVSLNTKYRT